MDKTLTNKILITLAFLFAYRILAYVPVPGVNVDVIKEFFNSNNSNALGLFNMFSGKAAERLSIISLGIMPYITASSSDISKVRSDEKRARRYAKIYANHTLCDYRYHSCTINRRLYRTSKLKRSWWRASYHDRYEFIYRDLCCIYANWHYATYVDR